MRCGDVHLNNHFKLSISWKQFSARSCVHYGHFPMVWILVVIKWGHSLNTNQSTWSIIAHTWHSHYNNLLNIWRTSHASASRASVFAHFGESIAMSCTMLCTLYGNFTPSSHSKTSWCFGGPEARRTHFSKTHTRNPFARYKHHLYSQDKTHNTRTASTRSTKTQSMFMFMFN